MKILPFFLLLLTAGSAQSQLMLSAEQAIEDLREFQRLLDEESSYARTTDYDYRSAVGTLLDKFTRRDSVSDHELYVIYTDILFSIGDRHSKVYARLNEDADPNLERRFPLALANHDNRLLALRQTGRLQYGIYDEAYPYLESIEGMEVNSFLDRYSPRHRTAPVAAKLTRGAGDLMDIGELYFGRNEMLPPVLQLVLTDGERTRPLKFTLTDEGPRYWAIDREQNAMHADFVEEAKFDSLLHFLNEEVAYLSIPRMYSFEEFPKLKTTLSRMAEQLTDAENLIIDLRYNTGGSRDIIDLLSPYIVPVEQSPWVANVAYVRTDSTAQRQFDGMAERYLFPYDSGEFDAKDRPAIDRFMQDFRPQRSFDGDQFSEPHYMVFRSGPRSFRGHIFLLVNERSFSAASIFASTMKGLNNVTLVGETTDGSSGRSQTKGLPHSGMGIKVSTMLSFQRNGFPLDGYGTEPDLRIVPDTTHIFGLRDSQLEAVLDFIENGYRKAVE